MSRISISSHAPYWLAPQLTPMKLAFFILLAPTLTACGGGDKVKVFFNKNVQPELSTCRTCHVKGGIADIPTGRRFMLSNTTSQDYSNFKSSWTTLGGGVQTNAILVKNSDFKAAHTGGVNWPAGSQNYNNVMKVLQCWENANNCSLTSSQASASTLSASLKVATALPLLELGQKQSPVSAGCAGQPDNTPLPLDPRTLVVPGINKPGVAVQFNGFWEDLHTPAAPFRTNKFQAAQTCGEWRASVAAGKEYVMHESSFFGGTHLLTTNVFNELWKSWGLSERPANYDDEIMRRYGFTRAEFRNPYPLEGEDPNLTNGGSGQLPLGMVLVKDTNTQQYTGEVTLSCSACHDSQLGPNFVWGRGTAAFDLGLLLSDVAKRTSTVPATLPPFPFSLSAGVTNAPGIIDALLADFDPDTLDFSPGKAALPFHASAGQMKTSNWWNRGYMTRLWHGALSGDHVRSSAALSAPNLMESGQQRRNTEAKLENVHAFLNSLAPPAFPFLDKIDTQLAEEGAELFHTLDLWANDANAKIPKQPGNGSCASCHGVYSPRYAADINMLPDPRLKGIAGVITPLATIRTDATLAKKMAPKPIQNAWAKSWWGYNDLNPNWPAKGKANNNKLNGPGVFSTVTGYSAPSLYGVWAAAPYFHNGSVPTIWGVLKPSDRPKIWKPLLQAAIAPGLNPAFDTSYEAYDFDHLGYKFNEIPCEKGASRLSCNPSNTAASTMTLISKTQGEKLWQAYQSMSLFDAADLEARHVINTREYSRGNGGHDFTKALSDPQRYAIIEYLKTL